MIPTRNYLLSRYNRAVRGTVVKIACNYSCISGTYVGKVGSLTALLQLVCEYRDSNSY